MRRVVVDPGVLISAAIGAAGNAPDLILTAVRRGELQLIVSPKLLAELLTVLDRPKFRENTAHGRLDDLVALVAAGSTIYNDPEPGAQPLTPDPRDDYLVALAQAVEAEYIVSGDSHLTRPTSIVPPVLTPRQLVDRLGL